MSQKPTSIIHLGGEDCVTGSCHLLQGSSLNIMIDCGLAQGNDHLLAMAEWPVKPAENDIVFVGYQVRGTPGYDIIKYGQRPGGYVRLNNEKFFLRAGIEQLSCYSAHADHADQAGLLAWVDSIPEKPGKIKLVHGDDKARYVLREVLQRQGYGVLA